jgi:para-aminobenzoate synthetase/4-amino-4-deoxychorismate lyase
MPVPRFDLVELMPFEAERGIVELDRHLARLKRSAETLGFTFDRHLARNELQAATFRSGPAQVRLLLSRSGAIAIEMRPRPEPPTTPVRVALAPLPLDEDDPRLRHFTTNRFAIDAAREQSGAFEILFTDKAGFFTQGSISHIFVPQGGRLATPPLTRTVRPGILRELLIDRGDAVEADLRPDDLRAGFSIGNSLLGLVEAELA